MQDMHQLDCHGKSPFIAPTERVGIFIQGDSGESNLEDEKILL